MINFIIYHLIMKLLKKLNKEKAKIEKKKPLFYEEIINMTNNGEKNTNKTNKIYSGKKTSHKIENNTEEKYNKEKKIILEINNIKHENNNLYIDNKFTKDYPNFCYNLFYTNKNSDYKEKINISDVNENNVVINDIFTLYKIYGNYEDY